MLTAAHCLRWTTLEMLQRREVQVWVGGYNTVRLHSWGPPSTSKLLLQRRPCEWYRMDVTARLTNPQWISGLRGNAYDQAIVFFNASVPIQPVTLASKACTCLGNLTNLKRI